jgi:hypothetical protein
MRIRNALMSGMAMLLVPAVAHAASFSGALRQTCGAAAVGRFGSRAIRLGNVESSSDGYAVYGTATVRDGSAQPFVCSFDPRGDLEAVDADQGDAPGGYENPQGDGGQGYAGGYGAAPYGADNGYAAPNGYGAPAGNGSPGAPGDEGYGPAGPAENGGGYAPNPAYGAQGTGQDGRGYGDQGYGGSDQREPAGTDTFQENGGGYADRGGYDGRDAYGGQAQGYPHADDGHAGDRFRGAPPAPGGYDAGDGSRYADAAPLRAQRACTQEAERYFDLPRGSAEVVDIAPGPRGTYRMTVRAGQQAAICSVEASGFVTNVH